MQSRMSVVSIVWMVVVIVLGPVPLCSASTSSIPIPSSSVAVLTQPTIDSAVSSSLLLHQSFGNNRRRRFSSSNSISSSSRSSSILDSRKRFVHPRRSLSSLPASTSSLTLSSLSFHRPESAKNQPHQQQYPTTSQSQYDELQFQHDTEDCFDNAKNQGTTRKVYPSSARIGAGNEYSNNNKMGERKMIGTVSMCSNSNSVVAVQRSIVNTLLRGSLLRIASDLSGGTPLESIKTRVTISKEGAWEATQNIIRERGFLGLYTGSASRTVEGALIGAVFMLGSVVTKRQLKSIGCPPTIAALAGGLVGGIAQSVVMTPAGMVFTALSANSRNAVVNQQQQNKQSQKIVYKNENAISICKRIIADKGIGGLYIGMGPMCLRQASNWASRSGFTEIARSTLGLSKYGLTGELISGIIGGVGSCWNTPIETIRVFSQRDVSLGGKPKSMPQYWNEIVSDSGYQGLFRGVTPRAIQAIWQTTFLVVVPNMMGI